MARSRQATDRSANPSSEAMVRTGYTISDDAHRRLVAMSAYTRRDQSEIVDELIRTHIVGYSVSYRDPRRDKELGEVA
jgi:hypothetical protein